MANQRAQAFADAVQQLESSGDVDAFVSGRFADDAQLFRPETGQELTGTDGATQYWQQYLGQFDEVHSEFDRVSGGDGSPAVLEWSSAGKLSGGAPIEYRGVSLVDFDDQGHVTRFATYFDTARFATPTAS
jgi:hypothetical protein